MQEPSFKPLEKNTQKLIKMMFLWSRTFVCLQSTVIHTKYSLQLNKMLHMDYVDREDEKDAVLPFKKFKN